MKKEKLNIILPEKKGFQVGDIIRNKDGDLYEITSINSAECELKHLPSGNTFSGFPLSDIKTYFKKLRRRAEIRTVKSGKNKGQFYVVMIFDNHEPAPEVYKTKQAALKTIKKYFPSFKPVIAK